jgi:C4-dicarboxylate-specific signal transduction histidine kinase
MESIMPSADADGTGAQTVCLQQVLVNPITNAPDAMADNVIDRPRTLTISPSSTDRLQVEVAVEGSEYLDDRIRFQE